MFIVINFINEFKALLELIESNRLLHLELLVSSIQVLILLLLTFVGLKFKIVNNLFSVHKYENEPVNFLETWKIYFSAPLMSGNGICMWRIIASIPLGISAITFYYDPIISFIIFQIYVFLFTTDALDGAVARIKKNVTEIGKILDPLADKILDLVALFIVCFFANNIFFMIITFNIIFLDIQGQLLRGKSKNPAASWVGKTKTIIKVFTIYIISLNRYDLQLDYIGGLLLILTLIFTIWSFYGKLSPKMKARSIDFLRRFLKRKIAS